MNAADQPPKTARDYVRNVMDIAPLLSALERGAIIRKTVRILMQVLAGILGMFLIIFWIKTWGLLKDVRFFTGLAVVIWQLAFPCAGYLALKLLFARAADVRALPDSDYVVAPIVGILVTVYGEMVFVFLGVMSLPLALMAWCVTDRDTSTFWQLTVMPVTPGFVGGFKAFLGCWAVGFGALLLTRLLRECLMAVFSIAQDVHLLRRRGELPAKPAA